MAADFGPPVGAEHGPLDFAKFPFKELRLPERPLEANYPRCGLPFLPHLGLRQICRDFPVVLSFGHSHSSSRTQRRFAVSMTRLEIWPKPVAQIFVHVQAIGEFLDGRHAPYAVA
jgi:hypothetical protein